MRSLSSAVARIIVPPSAFVSGVIGLAVAIPLICDPKVAREHRRARVERSVEVDLAL